MGSIIGSKLKDLRKNQGWTIEDLAKKLDVSVGIISEWERGIKEPRPSTRKKLCELYRITEASLFEDANDEDDLETNGDRIVCNQSAAFDLCESSIRTDKSVDQVNFSYCREAVIDDDAMAPIARKGQRIIYSVAEAPIKDSDLVYVMLRDGRRLFRYSRQVDKDMIMLTTANPAAENPAMMVKLDEIEEYYKVMGVRY